MGFQNALETRFVKRKWLFVLLCLLFHGLSGQSWGVPALPHTVYGNVQTNGANVPDGTVVSTWIGGVLYGSTTTMTYEGDSVFVFHILGDDTETAEKEGGIPGEAMSFRVGSDGGNASLFFVSGGSTRVNLTSDHMLSDISVGQDEWCGGNAPCCSSIQSAINLASSYTLINMSAEIYSEEVVLNGSKVLMLQGGWDPTFTAHSSSTTIYGSLTIDDGKIIVQDLVVQ